MIIVWSASHLVSAFLEYYKGQSEYSDIREKYGIFQAAVEVDAQLQAQLQEKENSLLEKLQSKLETWQKQFGGNGIEEQHSSETVIRYVGERQYIRDGSIIVNGVDMSFYIAATYVKDLNELKAINSEVLGWIQIDGTNIDYPFAQATDNEKYIRQTIYGTANAAGSIFVDCNVQNPFYTENTIIYGHNQRNKQMFHDLVNYEEADYLQEHSVIMIYLENETRIYQIFSCYITQNVSITYDCNYSSEGEYQNYLDQITAWSLYDTGISVSTSDEIITLSTCTNDWEDRRFIVHAKRVL